VPTPVITASTRYFNPGVTKCYYLPTLASSSLIPTRAEMSSGTDLSPEIADLSGWTVTGEVIDTPDLASTFTGQIAGRTSAEDSELTLHASITGVDGRALLPRGATGYIMWCDGGDIAGRKADVFPILVRSVGQMRSVGDENARLQIQFSVTRVPAESITIPA